MSGANISPAPQTIVLRLVTGLQYGTSIIEPAPDIPPGAVLIEAPLYAGANATTREQVAPFFHYPATPYLKSAAAAFLAPLGREDAMAWYRLTMPDYGYVESGHGQTGTPDGISGRWDGVHSLAIQFDSLNHRRLTLHLSFESVAPEETHVLYVATVETLPPRARESYLGAVAEIDVTYRFPYSRDGTDQRNVRFTLTDATVIEDLTHEINDLTDVAAGISSGFDRGESATLICRDQGGSETRVEVEHGRSVRVGETRSLDDIRMRVLRAVARLAASTE